MAGKVTCSVEVNRGGVLHTLILQTRTRTRMHAHTQTHTHTQIHEELVPYLELIVQILEQLYSSKVVVAVSDTYTTGATAGIVEEVSATTLCQCST